MANAIPIVFTIRIIAVISATIIGPLIILKIAQQKEIGAIDPTYFKALIASLVNFTITYLPFFILRLFFIRHLPEFIKNYPLFGLSMGLWFIFAFFISTVITKQIFEIDYLKSMTLWGVSFILTTSISWFLSMFLLVLLRLSPVRFPLPFRR